MSKTLWFSKLKQILDRRRFANELFGKAARRRRSAPAAGQRSLFGPDHPTKDDCGANAEGGGGFQPGNSCASGGGSRSGGQQDAKANDRKGIRTYDNRMLDLFRDKLPDGWEYDRQTRTFTVGAGDFESGTTYDRSDPAETARRIEQDFEKAGLDVDEILLEAQLADIGSEWLESRRPDRNGYLMKTRAASDRPTMHVTQTEGMDQNYYLLPEATQDEIFRQYVASVTASVRTDPTVQETIRNAMAAEGLTSDRLTDEWLNRHYEAAIRERIPAHIDRTSYVVNTFAKQNNLIPKREKNQTQKVMQELGVKPTDIQKIVGAGKDWEYDLIASDDGKRLTITSRSNRFGTQHRTLYKDAGGNLVLKHDLFRLNSHAVPPGEGALIFSSAIAGAREIGVKKIVTSAAGSGEDYQKGFERDGDNNDAWTGYAVWPMFGYEANLESSYLGSKVKAGLKEKFPKAETILDVMDAPGGRQWWWKNGEGLSLTFDLQDGSRSMNHLNGYLKKKKESRKKAVKDLESHRAKKSAVIVKSYMETHRQFVERLFQKAAKSSKDDCGANAEGGGGFQPGNSCASGDKGKSKEQQSGRKGDSKEQQDGTKQKTEHKLDDRFLNNVREALPEGWSYDKRRRMFQTPNGIDISRKDYSPEEAARRVMAELEKEGHDVEQMMIDGEIENIGAAWLDDREPDADGLLIATRDSHPDITVLSGSSDDIDFSDLPYGEQQHIEEAYTRSIRLMLENDAGEHEYLTEQIVESIDDDQIAAHVASEHENDDGSDMTVDQVLAARDAGEDWVDNAWSEAQEQLVNDALDGPEWERLFDAHVENYLESYGDPETMMNYARENGLLDHLDRPGAENLMDDFGLTHEDIAKLVGTDEMWSYEVMLDDDSDSEALKIVSTSGPGRQARKIYRDHDGELVLYHDYFELEDSNPKGEGSLVLSSAVAAARELGFNRIETYAAGSAEGVAAAMEHQGEAHTAFTGFGVWPMLGFEQKFSDTPLKSETMAAVREKFPDAESIQDIMDAPGGSRWWWENGSGLRETSFDLQDGSRSMNRLNAYLTKKKQDRVKALAKRKIK